MFFKSKKPNRNIPLDEAAEQLYKIAIHNVEDSYLHGIMRGINYKIPLKETADIELLLSNYSAIVIALNVLIADNDAFKRAFPGLLDKLHEKIYKFVSNRNDKTKNDFNELTQARQNEYLRCLAEGRTELGEEIYLHLSAESEAPIYARQRDHTLCKMLGVKFFVIQKMAKNYFKKTK